MLLLSEVTYTPHICQPVYVQLTSITAKGSPLASAMQDSVSLYKGQWKGMLHPNYGTVLSCVLYTFEFLSAVSNKTKFNSEFLTPNLNEWFVQLTTDGLRGELKETSLFFPFLFHICFARLHWGWK